jgi:hypothetical protein
VERAAISALPLQRVSLSSRTLPERSLQDNHRFKFREPPRPASTKLVCQPFVEETDAVHSLRSPLLPARA